MSPTGPELRLPAGSHAILIGVSAYEDEQFPSIRAARNSLRGMRQALTDPRLCGWPAESVTLVSNPGSAAELAVTIARIAERTPGVLLLYYVGHGSMSVRGELCLTTTTTDAAHPSITGLTWSNVAEIVRSSPARVRMVILDCCFAGQAIEALAGASGSTLADVTHVDGVYTLTATTRNHTAHVPPPAEQSDAPTSFTGELLGLLHTGIPGGPPTLALGSLYPVLRNRLIARGLPRPNQRGTDTVSDFPFCRNSALYAGGPSVQDLPSGDHVAPKIVRAQRAGSVLGARHRTRWAVGACALGVAIAGLIHSDQGPGAAAAGCPQSATGTSASLSNEAKPAHQWPLADGAGAQRASDLAGGAPLPLVGGATWTDDPMLGATVQLDGKSGYLSLPARVSQPNQGFAISLRIKTAVPGGIILSAGPAPTRPGIPPNTYEDPTIYVGLDGRLYAQPGADASNPIATPTSVADGMWHTVTLSATSCATMLYLDGQPVGSQETKRAPTPPTLVGVGYFNPDQWPSAPGATWSYFAGSISALSYFAEALDNNAAQHVATKITLRDPQARAVIHASSQNYMSGSVWYAASTTMQFEQGVLSITDNATGDQLWSAGTAGLPNAALRFHPNGSLVISPVPGGRVSTTIWTAPEAARTGDTLTLQADGNLVIDTASGIPLWDSETLRSDTWTVNTSDCGNAVADSDGVYPAQGDGPIDCGPVTDSRGVTRRAVIFDGKTCLWTGGPVIPTTSSYTISAWVDLSGAVGTEDAVAQQGAIDSSFYLGSDGSVDTWVFATDPTDGFSETPVRSSSHGPPSSNTWTHLVGVFDRNSLTMTLYVNGGRQPNVTNATPFASHGSLLIGCGQFNFAVWAYFSGAVSDIQVFAYALTPPKIAALT